jgi:hypothetical protein
MVQNAVQNIHYSTLFCPMMVNALKNQIRARPHLLLHFFASCCTIGLSLPSVAAIAAIWIGGLMLVEGKLPQLR